MKNKIKSTAALVLAIALGAAMSATAAPAASKEAHPAPMSAASGFDQGVSADTILVGRTTGLTGILSRSAQASEAGLRAVWDDTNAHGGVFHKSIVQKTIDDGYEVERTKAGAIELITEDKVFALVFTNGTPHSNALLPIVDKYKTPLLGSSSGSVMRDPKQFTRYFFNTRNDNKDDVEAIVDHLKVIGDPKICSVYEDDGYGKTMEGLLDAAAARDGVEIVGKVAMTPGAKDARSVIAELTAAGCDHVGNIAMLMLDKATGVFLKAYKAQGALEAQSAANGLLRVPTTQRLFSTTSSDGFEIEAGREAAGHVIVAQSTPPMTSFETPALNDFRRLMLSKPATAKYVNSVLAFQGYLTAKVFVAALTEAGPTPTRERFVDALEKFKRRDMGGLFFDYTSAAHEGMHYTELFEWSASGTIVY